jgi:diguanylate cyclase (GGDEF)-like protein
LKQTELKVVTDDTLKELRNFDVITPDLYTDAFASKLKVMGLETDLDVLSQNNVPLILDKILKIQKETQEGTKVLKENIDLATIAIHDKDEEALASIKEHMSALQDRIAALEEEVYIDDLTKAYNRKWLFDKVLKDDKFTQDGVLTFIDLDKFKVINDSYGHIAGDKVLFLISNVLQKLEGVDVIRFGGDEFIMISFTKDLEYIEEYLFKINEGFKTKSFKFQGHTFKVGLSSGSSTFKAGNNFHEITGIVDEKMYEAKRAKKEAEAALA